MNPKLLGMVFPGQGSQKPGMLEDYYQAETVFRETFEQSADQLNIDLWKLVSEGEPSDLANTVITQTLMLTADIAVWRVWQSHTEVLPAVMSGHSLGEFSALVAAGYLEFKAALTLVKTRAELMQGAVPNGQGGMGALVGLDLEAVEQVCRDSADKTQALVNVANLNAPGQTVVGGHLKAVEMALVLAKEAGAKKAVLLPMSVPSHCALLSEAAEEFQEALMTVSFNRGDIPVIHNVHAEVAGDAEQVRSALYRQLFSPVRWVECVQKMTEFGAENLIECGPGKVLTGLNKRIVPSKNRIALDTRETFLQTIEQLDRAEA